AEERVRQQARRDARLDTEKRETAAWRYKYKELRQTRDEGAARWRREFYALKDRRERRNREQEERLYEEGRDAGRRGAAEENRRKDRQIAALSREVREMQRRLESVSPQERGAFQEEEITERLERTFGGEGDKFESLRGKGDRLAHVAYPGGRGQSAGRILIECKDTKDCKPAYVVRIRSDSRRHDTDHMLLVTRTFPPRREKECDFFLDRGVLIVKPKAVVQGYALLREHLIRLQREGLSGQAQREKTGRLIAFLRSVEGRRAFDALVDGSDEARDLLKKDRDYADRSFERRRALCQRLAENATRLRKRVADIIE